MNTILVFAGAGASKAVAPEKYPTTIEFLEGLNNEIRQNNLFYRVEEFLKQGAEDKILDIELILWRLQELRSFCEAGTDRAQFPGWLIGTGFLISALGLGNQNIGNFHSVAASAIQKLDSLIGRINLKVYDLYSQLPTQDELMGTWGALLKGCEDLGAKTEIVTTNYDMVIESALDINPVADNGWRGSVVRTLDVDLWNQSPNASSRGLLTKLHGSVNWSKKDDRIFISDPNFKGSHTNHAIIYPGFKGRPTDAYFLSFHEHFRRSIQSARVVVFIGFAFRDQYINDICAAAIGANTTVISINRNQIQLPFATGRHRHVTGSFDKAAVESCMETIRQSLGVA